MNKNKQEVVKFFAWMRNGIAFCTSWFLLLWILYDSYFNIESISVNSLAGMFLFVAGGVFLFSSIFTKLFIRKSSFVVRLTCFMFLFGIYESITFYYTGFFGSLGTFLQWTAFVAIILISYVICIAMYRVYSKKQGDIYTEGLQKYQQKREAECEK